jgi:hypothetical protein
MGQDFISHDASIVRGYAWHVYPDPATPGVLAGDNPFGTDEPPEPRSAGHAAVGRGALLAAQPEHAGDPELHRRQ